ncbi:MAG: sugar ABC transporter ATP-binding protein [Firmicutes bacterium]|nr:sugar ABC transporter ATP-binding protein [Bacillota bacterium]
MPNININPSETNLFVRGIAKTFGTTRALKGIDLVIRPGEVHGLLGQNGCGKSTLIKILAGYHEPDKGGEIWINGEKVPLPIEPGGFMKYGISFVHQDLGLIPSLTVLENWLLTQLSTENKYKVDWHREKIEAKKIFERYGLNINPDSTVANLTSVEKAMFAIIRAVVNLKISDIVKKKKRGLLILDEPTVFLPRSEVSTLFGLVRGIASEGISVMFVSHDIDEVIELTDGFTVLRDGMNVGEGITKQCSKEKIVEIILGKKLQKYHNTERDNSVEDKNHKKRASVSVRGANGLIINDLDIDIHPGEIVGVTGLIGSGFEELPYILCGAQDYQSGTLTINGRKNNLSTFSPRKAVDNRISLIPVDRAGSGGIGDLSVEDNINMQVTYRYRPYFLQKKGLRQNAEELVKKFDVRPANPLVNFAQLSGGNQQKVLLAKWVQEQPELLILHEPSQGVDVGARQQIYRHIDTVAKNGAAVLCSSSDYEELEQICSRVIILVKGRIHGELVGAQITKENITKMCFAVETEAAS